MTCPRYAAAHTPDQAAAAAARIGYPVVVKPASGTGSIAVRLCQTPDQVRAAVAHAFAEPDPALPPQDTVLVEEFLTGAEYSAELIDDQVVGITRKLLGPEPYFVEIGHDFPAPLAEADRRRRRDGHRRGARPRPGLRRRPRRAPLLRRRRAVRRRGQPAAGGRHDPARGPGGDRHRHDLQRGGGSGGPPGADRAPAQRAASIRFLVAAQEGTLTGVEGVAEAKRPPGVVEVGITFPVGQPVVPRHSFRDRLGYVIAAAADHDEAARAATRASRC